jgi:hypothetical protein
VIDNTYDLGALRRALAAFDAFEESEAYGELTEAELRGFEASRERVAFRMREVEARINGAPDLLEAFRALERFITHAQTCSRVRLTRRAGKLPVQCDCGADEAGSGMYNAIEKAKK